MKIKIDVGETENSFPLYKAETIFNRKLNSKVEFCGSGKGCAPFLCEFCDVVIAIG